MLKKLRCFNCGVEIKPKTYIYKSNLGYYCYLCGKAIEWHPDIKKIKL